MERKSSRRDYSMYCCPECGEGSDVVEDYSSGDTVCRGCGFVVGERMVDEHSEWRTFSNSDDGGGVDPNRVGGPSNPLLQDGGLSTMISRGEGGSSSAKKLGIAQNKVSFDAADRSLTFSFREIASFAEQNSLPQSVADLACEIFKHAGDIEKLRGRNKSGVVAASLYIACRLNSVPRSFKEICALTQVPMKKIARSFKHIMEYLKDKNIIENLDTITATAFMNRFCNQLALPTKVMTAAAILCNEAMRLGLVAGKSPISIAAAGIYMVSQLNGTVRTQKTIADVTGITEATVKSTYRDLYPRRTELLPADSEFQRNMNNLPMA
eukprot:TRINITY_DN884_c0_g3_i2.p1 TRINITY_DN884_c0_g3~~TRINITY_DN884_c0_g3_i2.p1  ORF type:complete len:324 (+),score=60.05 TRINITY_DN884_c0_g3_i2:139-1110(+)